MTEEAGFAEPAAAAPVADSAGLPGTGPVAEEAPGAEPGTDAPDAAAAEQIEQPAAAEPAAAEPAAAEPAEPAAAEPEPAEAISPTAGAPDPMPAPFIPSEGVAPWLREALTWLHDRIRNLEG